MTSRKQFVCCLAFAIFLLILTAGCGSEASHWEKTKQTNTAEAYKSFLNNYPNSQYVAEAKTRIEELEWADTKAKNTLEGYRDYTAKYPTSNRIIRAAGQFNGHAIMVGDDGHLLTGMFGSAPPKYEIRLNSSPDFVYQMSFSDAVTAGLLKEGRMELAGNYTYPNGEMIVFITRSGDVEVYTLVYFKSDQVAYAKDDGRVISSKAKTLSVMLLNPSTSGK